MDDLISRQKAVVHLKKRLIETAINNIGLIAPCDRIFEDIADNRIGPWLNELTSAQPERKRGKWIDYANSHCECSVCHTEWSYFQNETECFEFCPNCGADMRGETDE